MENSESEALKEELLNRRQRLEGDGHHLLEQAGRVEKLYGQKTARSEGYRSEWRLIRLRTQPKIDKINEALQELEEGNPEKALAIAATPFPYG